MILGVLRGGSLRPRQDFNSLAFFSSVTIDPGHFGIVMARERSHGLYPVTIVTLDLIKELVAIVSSSAETSSGSKINDFIACVVFVCRDVFTAYQKWYYGDLREKQEIGKYLHAFSCGVWNTFLFPTLILSRLSNRWGWDHDPVPSYCPDPCLSPL